MRTVIIANAKEGLPPLPSIGKLWARLKGNVELLERDGSQSIRTLSKKADFLVIFFSTASPQSQQEEISPRDQKKAESSLLLLGQGDRMELSPALTKLVVISVEHERASLPPDLAGYSCYNLSSTEEEEALLCKLVHDPVNTRWVTPKAYSAAAQIFTGGVATVVGNSDRIREFVFEQVGERTAQIVHYCMVAVVVFLLFTGLFSFIQIALNQLRDALGGGILQRLPQTRRLRQVIVGTVTAGIVIAFGHFFLPKAPQLTTTVDKNVTRWTMRLENSLRPDGGIREHPDEGVSQVWCTAQSLTALLVSERWASNLSWGPNFNTNIQSGFDFIDRTKIIHVVVNQAGRQGLQQWAYPADISRIPASFPTYTLALNMISHLAGWPELSSHSLQSFDLNKSNFFTPQGPFDGWGYYEQFPTGVTEIIGWVTIAEIQSLRATSPSTWSTVAQRSEIKQRIRENITLLRTRRIHRLGAYSPIADASDIAFARTYSTVMALWATAEATSSNLDIFTPEEISGLTSEMGQSVKWLGNTVVHDDKNMPGWKVNPGNPTAEVPFLGLTAQTLCILGRLPIRIDEEAERRINEVKVGLLNNATTWTTRSPGVNDRMHDADSYLYPTDFQIESSTFLWYPWCVGMLRSFSTDSALTRSQQLLALKWMRRLQERAPEFGSVVESEYNYVAAEGLIGFNYDLTVQNKPGL